MHLEKADIDLPISGDHPVTAFMHGVGKIVQDGLPCRWPHISIKTVLAEHFVNRAGGDGGQEFSLWVGPAIGTACLKKQRAGRDERNQEIGVHGCSVGKACIPGIVRCKLVWVAGWSGEMRNGLSIIAVTEGRASFPRTTGDDGGKSLVVRTGPHHGFAKARDPDRKSTRLNLQ